MHRDHLRHLSASNEALKKELEEARRRLKQRQTTAQERSYGLSLAQESPQEEEESWFSTYLDLMTLLLVLMLVMLAFAGAGGQGTESRSGFELRVIQTGEGSGDDLLPGSRGLLPEQGTKLQAAAPHHAWQDVDFSGLGDDIDVILEDESVSFRINSEILFASAQADLSLAGLAVLKKLLPVFKDNEIMITVEGHTDSVPIRSARFPSNWELSGARAGSVVRYLEANGIHSERLRAVGYADTRPLGSNDTVQGRASNRRVELTIGIDADAPLPSFD